MFRLILSSTWVKSLLFPARALNLKAALVSSCLGSRLVFMPKVFNANYLRTVCWHMGIYGCMATCNSPCLHHLRKWKEWCSCRRNSWLIYSISSITWQKSFSVSMYQFIHDHKLSLNFLLTCAAFSQLIEVEVSGLLGCMTCKLYNVVL